MPRSEDDGNLLAVVGLQRGQEVRHVLHPALELLVILTARQYLLDDGAVGDVPCCAGRKLLAGPSATFDGGDRIARVPAEGDDAATLVVLQRLFPHAGKGHAVQILGVAHLDAAQVEAHHGRIVATNIFHVARIRSILPGESIHRVVLMAIHDALLLQCLQPVYQLFTLCLLCYGLLTTGCHHQGYTY